jgi:hypothetical protein
MGGSHASVALKVFVCQLANTVILTLVLRSNFGPVRAIPGQHFKHVNAEWFGSIGAPLVTTMIIQYLTPPAFHAIAYVVRFLKVKFISAKFTTQNSLNAYQL